MNKNERLQRRKRMRKEKRKRLDQLEARIKRLRNEDKAVPAAVATEVRSIVSELEELEEDIADLESTIRRDGGRAGDKVYAQAKEPKQPGERIARMAVAVAASKSLGISAAEWAEKTYGTDDVVERALAASVPGAGGVTIPTDLVQELIEQLVPATVVRQSGPIILGMPHGNATIPRQSGGAGASYIGENTDIPSSEQTFDSITLTAKKLVALVPISNDLVRRSVIGMEEMVRRDIITRIALREDLAFLRGDGTANTPKGIRNLIPAGNVLPVTAPGYNVFSIAAALSAMQLKLKNANVGMLRPVWFMAPRLESALMSLRNAQGFAVYKDEMMQGKLDGIPYRTTTQLPTNLGVGGNEAELYLIDMSEAVIGDGLSLALDVSSEATYLDSVSGQLTSAYSKDQSVIRAITEHDFNLRHAESAVVMTGIKWAPGADPDV